jgi:hypothetical protein
MDEAVCGPGDASGDTDQGVTDDAIRIGTISDPGNTIIPGLLQELFDAAEAFTQWCNEAGGINGRPIELTLRDTELVEGQQRITEACGEDFMLVGGGSGLDSALAEPRVECELPQIPAFVNDPAAQDADLQVVPTGLYPDYLPGTLYQRVAENFPDEIENYGLLTPDLQSSGRPDGERIPEAVAELGFDAVYTGQTPPPPATVDNWRPYVEAAESAGTQVFEYRQVPDQVRALMTAFGDVGFAPDVMLGNPALYSQALIEGNEALADVPMYVETNAYPFEMADENPPTRQFLDLLDATVPDWSDDPKATAVDAWSAWLLFARSATACGSELTRECVLDEAASVGSWDAGGIRAPVEISVGEPAGPMCAAVVRATPDGFEYDEELTDPNEGVFNCSEDNRLSAPR